MEHRGYTLVELLVALCLLAILVGMGVPRARGWWHDAAVQAAREELAGALAWTRIAAVSHGGATLVLTPATGRFHTRTAAGVSPAVDLHGRYRVRLEAGAADTVLFHYDALGIGRLTNRTIRIRRGSAEAGLTISSYGRYRRW